MIRNVKSSEKNGLGVQIWESLVFVIFEAMNLNEVTQRKSINKNRKLGDKNN